ncbi:MAG: cysteine desulfurase family protein [Anaerolineae bacterium]
MPANASPIYLDHAATTPVDPQVLAAMLPYLGAEYGNPSSLYRLAGRAHAALDQARLQVAEVLHARPREVVFTSCGSESDNLALRGVAVALRERGRHLITSAIEHHAIGRTCAYLERYEGFRVTTLPVDGQGLVDPDDVGRAITPETVLISVMYANNEVGTIQPVAEIARIAHARGVLFHTDAVQAAGSLDLDVDALGVDLLSLSGHKFYAPKGVGALYVRDGTPLVPQQTGGGQERGRRAGTENVAFAVALGHALQLAYEHQPGENQRLAALRDRLIQGLLDVIPGARLTGHPTHRLPNNASLLFPGLEGEALLLQLDLAGIAAGSGSACAAAEEGVSHVLTAMGLDVLTARGSLRLTLGRSNTADEVERVIALLPPMVQRLRALSPLA